jgi:hypothetical protein
MNPHVRPTIDLDLNSPGLIVRHPSGVFYCNQVAGYACRQEAMEGVFVPLPAILRLGKERPPEFFSKVWKVYGPGNEYYSIDLKEAVEQIILGKYGSNCYSGIDGETADKLDSLLNLFDLGFRGLAVDRSKLDKCAEAWIFVTGENMRAVDGFEKFEGVLTWYNSD